MARGWVSVAAALGLSQKTWKKLRDEDPEAKQVWAEARGIELDRLVGSLFRQAVGSPAEYDDKGNCVRAEQPPVPIAAMFLLKSRHQYRDQGPTDGTSDGRPSVIINLPAALPADAYAKLITVTPSALPSPGEAA